MSKVPEVVRCGATEQLDPGVWIECWLVKNHSGAHEWRGVPAEPAPVVDMVAHPPHYRHPSGVECIDITEHMTFLRGNAMKYLWRAGSKGGPEQELEDLKKAAWYLAREISNLEAKQ